MKKIISLILCMAMCLCCMPNSALALDDGMSKVSVGVIKHYLQPSISTDFNHSDRPLEITVTVPEMYENSTVMVAFYTDGVMTKMMPVTISSSTKKGTVKLDMSNEVGDGLPATPDSIKLFTWSTGGLKPITKSHELLTSQTISSANARIVSEVLEYILGKGSKRSITQYVRDNINFETEHDKIDALLDKMDECAASAYEVKDSQLLTSEYARRTFYDDVSEAFNELEADKVQKNEFIRVYNNLNSGYEPTVKNVFKRLSYLLCINVENFIGTKQ